MLPGRLLHDHSGTDLTSTDLTNTDLTNTDLTARITSFRGAGFGHTRGTEEDDRSGF
ncbi:MAG: pentapeptide repeat-containing protein [Streptosporangiaceae bacterium]